MDLINKILEAIYELQSENCKDEDLIIAFSPLIERFIIKELYENRFIVPHPTMSDLHTLCGIKTYNLHPYNEVVVYDSKKSAYHPQLLKKISFVMKDGSKPPIIKAIEKIIQENE